MIKVLFSAEGAVYIWKWSRSSTSPSCNEKFPQYPRTDKPITCSTVVLLHAYHTERSLSWLQPAAALPNPTQQHCNTAMWSLVTWSQCDYSRSVCCRGSHVCETTCSLWIGADSIRVTMKLKSGVHTFFVEEEISICVSSVNVGIADGSLATSSSIIPDNPARHYWRKSPAISSATRRPGQTPLWFYPGTHWWEEQRAEEGKDCH